MAVEDAATTGAAPERAGARSVDLRLLGIKVDAHDRADPVVLHANPLHHAEPTPPTLVRGGGIVHLHAVALGHVPEEGPAHVPEDVEPGPADCVSFDVFRVHDGGGDGLEVPLR